jgi:hypothetical protein
MIAISWVLLPRACALGWFLRPFGPRDEAPSAIPLMPLKSLRTLKGHRSPNHLSPLPYTIPGPKGPRNQPRVTREAQTLGHTHTTTSFKPAL